MRNLDLKTIYYVYILFDWFGIPRYVGKGKGNRWMGHERGTKSVNPRKDGFIKQTKTILGEVPKIIIRSNMNELDAFDLEISLIKIIGRQNTNTGPLTNMTKGGEGSGGLIWSKESIENQRARQTKRMASLELREQIRLKLTGRKQSKDQIQRMIEVRHHSGIKQKPWSEEARLNASAAALRRMKPSIETRIKMGNSRRGKRHTQETKDKMSLAASIVQGPRRRRECQEDPRAIEHMRKMSHKRLSDPEDSAKRAEIARNLWKDPTYRENVLEARRLAKIKKSLQLQGETHIDN